MSTYTIGEVADRSGFSSSALRYYEEIGLLTPAARTEAGYRTYDDGAFERLAFIARAKQLGCSLEEITDLLTAWDGERCEPVQHRLHELVTGKIGEVQQQTVELVAFGAQLQAAAAQLAAQPVDGPCDDGCACATAATATMPVSVVFGARADAPAIACTLEGGLTAMTDRINEWRALLAHAVGRSSDGDVLRVELSADVPLAEVARLIAAEQACCTFFAFAITVDERGIALEVRAPAEAAEVVAAVFGVAG